MSWLVVKYLITAAIVVVASEAAKRSDAVGALVVALPMVSVLTLIWLAIEGQPEQRLADHAWLTFWFVLPTLPMFLVFPWLLPQIGFMGALSVSVVGTVGLFWLYVWTLKLIGLDLFP